MQEESTAEALREQVRSLKLLESAAQRLTSTLDLPELLESIVAEVAETFGCSRSAVLLFTPSGEELELVAVRGWTQNIHPRGFRFSVGGDGLLGKVSASGEMNYAPDVLREPRYVVSEPSTRTELDIPLKVRGRFIGVFNAQHPEVDAFPPERQQMFRALADHVAIAIENARLFTAERERSEALARESDEAHRMQARLLPAGPARSGAFTFEGRCQSARAVGGDWFDYFTLHHDTLAFALGDVSGKGMPAAMLMASVRSSLRQQARLHASPAAVLTHVNELLIADFPAGSFVTLVYGVLDVRQGMLTVASAAHPPPVLVERDSATVCELPPCLPLGLFPENYEQRSVRLAAEQRLLVYSDGVEEAMSASGEEFGRERICSFAAASADVHGFLDSVLAFRSEAQPTDDATALFISHDGEGCDWTK